MTHWSASAFLRARSVKKHMQEQEGRRWRKLKKIEKQKKLEPMLSIVEHAQAMPTKIAPKSRMWI